MSRGSGRTGLARGTVVRFPWSWGRWEHLLAPGHDTRGRRASISRGKRSAGLAERQGTSSATVASRTKARVPGQKTGDGEVCPRCQFLHISLDHYGPIGTDCVRIVASLSGSIPISFYGLEYDGLFGCCYVGFRVVGRVVRARGSGSGISVLGIGG